MNVPYQPLATWCIKHGAPTRNQWETDTGTIARLTGKPKNTILRWQRKGHLDYWEADRLACQQLHTHPANIWGHHWYQHAQTHHPQTA